MRAAPLLCAKFGKTGRMIMSELLVSFLMPPYCYSGLKWRIGIVTDMVRLLDPLSPNTCSKVIVLCDCLLSVPK